MAQPLTRTSRYVLSGLLIAALLFPYTVNDQFIVRLAIQSGIFILLASAHNILMKVGLLSLGPVAFYGLGAYVSAILTTRYDVPFPVAFLAAGLAATAAGWVIGRLTLRLRTAYFVLVTLGFAECFRLVALNWIDVTNGPMGITAVPPPARWFVGYVPYFYFILLLVVLTLFGLYRMEHSTIGRAMQAIRQNELLAGSVGISGFRYMMLAALLASFIMGLAGSFYAHFFQFLGPEILAFDLTIAIVVMVVAGGRATLMGPVLGAIVFTVLPEVLRVVQVWRMAIFGLLLMLMMLFMPDGIWPALQLLAQRCFERVTGRRTPAVVPSSLGSPSGSFAADSSRPPVPARVEHGVAPTDRSQTVLTVERLCVHFGGVQAVHMVDFDVKAGEILSIIGPNGAGKTTILNAITRVGPITAGEISHQDALLNGLRSYEVARHGIGRTFQHTSLFPDVSTRQNLVLAHNGLEPESLHFNLLRTDASVQAAQDAEVAADRILERTRLVPYGASLARSLPYGHQRVLELGIALAARPSLLLLDEPAAGLNPAEVNDLMALIQQVRHEGVTVVLVEHDMKLVMSVSDRIVVLDHGRKIAEGRPEEIRTNQRVVEAYLGKRG
ncbi:MAG: hypothetical protein CL480_11215 [Acidobacteria bacterium]|nr:hypothetical protein [Acidobacteriota bacterium]